MACCGMNLQTSKARVIFILNMVNYLFEDENDQKALWALMSNGSLHGKTYTNTYLLSEYKRTDTCS